jgi:hypothetical protein
MALKNRLRRLTKKRQKIVKKFFGRTRKRPINQNFAYQINVQQKQPKFRSNTKRGIL